VFQNQMQLDNIYDKFNLEKMKENIQTEFEPQLLYKSVRIM